MHFLFVFLYFDFLNEVRNVLDYLIELLGHFPVLFENVIEQISAVIDGKHGKLGG